MLADALSDRLDAYQYLHAALPTCCVASDETMTPRPRTRERSNSRPPRPNATTWNADWSSAPPGDRLQLEGDAALGDDRRSRRVDIGIGTGISVDPGVEAASGTAVSGATVVVVDDVVVLAPSRFLRFLAALVFPRVSGIVPAGHGSAYSRSARGVVIESASGPSSFRASFSEILGSRRSALSSVVGLQAALPQLADGLVHDRGDARLAGDRRVEAPDRLLQITLRR